ncbi:hypothetical protein PR202_ga16141 [Eleusine coracana subsp. coracana]|uniref:RING-type domain-containing protein n=1 Tax=Eleusine coracana subsp. coracana TaxID=191504 RepID=A0AAV5CM25_ELECO|nr:hypothetical protein PR202_ga16141 [Eleusine coracana subsp. coracana]
MDHAQGIIPGTPTIHFAGSGDEARKCAKSLSRKGPLLCPPASSVPVARPAPQTPREGKGNPSVRRRIDWRVPGSRMILILMQVCCICLTKYGDDDELRELPCKHFFHVQCVDKWLKINAVCPLCKTEIGGVVRSLFGLPFGRRRVDRMAGRGVASSRFNV